MLPREVRKPRAILRHRTVALIIAALASTCIYSVSQPSREHCSRITKEDVARIAVRKFMYEALPQWQQLHGVHCPPDLTALTPFMNSDDVKDPWGNPYVFVCNFDYANPGAIVLSTGPDGTLGTIDDDTDDDISAITAWRR